MMGMVVQNGCEFGCMVYVGLVDCIYGLLMFGCQYDVIYDYIGFVIIVSNGVNIGDNDNGYNDICVQYLVKYVSFVYYGLKFIVLYGFSNVIGFVNNSVYSFGFGYECGLLCWSVVYVQYNYFYSVMNQDGVIVNDYVLLLLIFSKSVMMLVVYVSWQWIVGMGGFYMIGCVQFVVMFIDVCYDYFDNLYLYLQNLGVNVVYMMMLQFFFGVVYVFMNGKYDVIDKCLKWYQVNLQVDYFLFKCIDVVLMVIVQQVVGDVDYVQIFVYVCLIGMCQMMVMFGVWYVF